MSLSRQVYNGGFFFARNPPCCCRGTGNTNPSEVINQCRMTGNYKVFVWMKIRVWGECKTEKEYPACGGSIFDTLCLG